MPGRERVVLNRASAVEKLELALGPAQRPSLTRGRCLIQIGPGGTEKIINFLEHPIEKSQG